jgi:hypothetical protein
MVILRCFFYGFIARFICSMIYSIQCGLSKQRGEAAFLRNGR